MKYNWSAGYISWENKLTSGEYGIKTNLNGARIKCEIAIYRPVKFSGKYELSLIGIYMCLISI